MSALGHFDSFFLLVLQRSILGAVLVLLLLLLGRMFRNRISPTLWFFLWLLVPIQLLFCVSIPSAWSVANFLPQKKIPTTPAMIQELQDEMIPISQAVIPENLDFEEGTPFENEEEPALYDAGFDFMENALPAPQPLEKKSQTTGVIPFRHLAIVWGCGVFCFFSVLFFQILRFRQMVRSGTTVTDEKTLRIFERCKKTMRVNSWTMLVESPRVKGPFLMGVVRPVVVLPQGFVRSLSPKELRHLFLHELAHLKRSDLVSGWLATLALGLHWFNPLAWIMLRKLNHLREEAADTIVLEQLQEMQKLDYGTTLITMSRKFAKPQLMPGIAGILETQTLLQRRIDMITNPIPRKKIWSIFVVCSCLALSLVLLTDAKNTDKEPSPVYPKADLVIVEQEEEAIASEKTATEPEEEKIDPKRVPKFVATYPKNRTVKVDPNITQVTVTFDIPMGEGRAWAQRSNQTALDFDEELTLFWTADRKTCVAPVRLKPNKTYEILMNVKPFIGFASEAGVPAGELFFTFKTGPGPVTEEKRAKYAAKNLTPEGNSPPMGNFLTGEEEKKAMDALKTMAERNRIWLAPEGSFERSLSYHYKNFNNGKTDKNDTDEYDIVIEKDMLADWEEACGTTYNSILHALVQKVNDEDERKQIKFKAFESGEKEIKIRFVTKEPLQFSCGNGMKGSWFGYFSGTSGEGVLTLDKKTLVPKQVVYGDGKIGERFSSYTKVDDDYFVPKKIQIKNGKMLFEKTFQLHEPHIWLLDKCVYKLPDGFQSTAEITNVKIQGDDDGDLFSN